MSITKFVSLLIFPVYEQILVCCLNIFLMHLFYNSEFFRNVLGGYELIFYSFISTQILNLN
jgi:hypothetical protein